MPDLTFAICLAPNHLSTDLSTDCQLAARASLRGTRRRALSTLHSSSRARETPKQLALEISHRICPESTSTGRALSRARVVGVYLVFLRGSNRSEMSLVIDTVLFILGILSWHSNRLCTEADSKMRSKMESMDGRNKRELLIFRWHWLCTGSRLS